MNDLVSLVGAVTAEAYALAERRGRLPERITVEASCDMDGPGRLLLSRSSRRPGQCSVRVELLPQAPPPGLRLIADHLAAGAVRGQKKNTRKKVNRSILYRRQGGYCAGCSQYFRPRNLTIDHVVPRSKGGSSDMSNLQLLCHACNQMKGSGTQGQLLAELRREDSSILA